MIQWAVLGGCVAYVLLGFILTSLETYYRGRKPGADGGDVVWGIVFWPFGIAFACLNEWHDWLRRKGGN